MAFSDDPEVDAAVSAAEADFLQAQEAHRANVDDPDAKARYDEASTAFANARQAARAGRAGMGITAEGGE